MTKNILICIVLLGAASRFCAAGWRGNGDDRRNGGRSIFKMRQVAVPRPYRFERPENVVDDNWRAAEPKRFGDGEKIRQPRETRPPAQHAEIARNSDFVKNIKSEQRVETLPGRYYWHNAGGARYAHFVDGRGIHWYGFYHDTGFYWSRYYADNWWWYDSAMARWVFWRDGYWWWWGPGGIAFVYMDNNYVPYDAASGAVVVRKPESVEPPKDLPAPGEGEKWVSPDKSRTVQIHGDAAEAFLYDSSGTPPIYLAYLGRDVIKARFSEGSPPQILVDFKDGTFALFDLDGKPQTTMTSKPPDIAPPSIPESAPSPPAPAPGR